MVVVVGKEKVFMDFNKKDKKDKNEDIKVERIYISKNNVIAESKDSILIKNEKEKFGFWFNKKYINTSEYSNDLRISFFTDSDFTIRVCELNSDNTIDKESYNDTSQKDLFDIYNK